MTVNYLTNSFFNSRTYILEKESRIWLVDCGDVAPLLPMLENKELKGVLLTHAHFDHIYGLNELMNHFQNISVYTNEFGREALLDERKNMSLYHETPFIFNYPDRIVIVHDGEDIELDRNIKANVIATPGHNPSCLTYMVGEALFTGDSYIPGTKVVTNLPKGNKIQAQNSLKKILTFANTHTIFPGHDINNPIL